MSVPPAKLPGVFIFSGDDTVGKENARSRAIKDISKAHPGVLVERYDSSAQQFSDYADTIMMPTLFGDIRIFIIPHAELLDENDLGLLSRMCDAIPEDAFIIIDIGVIAGKKKTKNDPGTKLKIAERGKDASGRCACMHFQCPPEYKTAQWLVDNTESLVGRPISLKAAELLVDLAGYDTAVLYSELQKLDLHLDAGMSVSEAAIREIVGTSRQMTMFELAPALAARNALRTMEIIDSLFTTAFSVPMMVSVLFRHYGALYRIRKYGDKNPQQIKFMVKSGGSFQAKNDAAFEIGCAAGLLHQGEERKVYPVMIASGIVLQAQAYSDNELVAIFRWLLEFDVAVKTGRMSGSRHEVELFCYKLLASDKLTRDKAAA